MQVSHKLIYIHIYIYKIFIILIYKYLCNPNSTKTAHRSIVFIRAIHLKCSKSNFLYNFAGNMYLNYSNSWYKSDNYGIKIFRFFLKRSINVIMDHCYSGKPTGSRLVKYIIYIYISIYIKFQRTFIICYECIFTNSSARAGYDTRSTFKWSLTGLNSEFSFS